MPGFDGFQGRGVLLLRLPQLLIAGSEGLEQLVLFTDSLMELVLLLSNLCSQSFELFDQLRVIGNDALTALGLLVVPHGVLGDLRELTLQLLDLPPHAHHVHPVALGPGPFQMKALGLHALDGLQELRVPALQLRPLVLQVFDAPRHLRPLGLFLLQFLVQVSQAGRVVLAHCGPFTFHVFNAQQQLLPHLNGLNHICVFLGQQRLQVSHVLICACATCAVGSTRALRAAVTSNADC
mmetsp:Transcript_24747/g.42432  ORF Transcript_24747/g.42432 Transcript_24747/m.42432 type:complete len:237 (+) Transcript_24747:194-904(+)